MTEVFDFRKVSDELIDRSYKLVMPVFFVGFMGGGWTWVGGRVARRGGVMVGGLVKHSGGSC